MVNNNLIFESISKNKYLSPEVKENFNELIKIYLTFYPEVDKETLASNMENLQVEQVNKYLIDEPVKYNNNKLLIKTSDFEKHYDYRHLLMREVIKMQSYKDKSKKQKNSQYDAIYEGYSSLCANYMVGNESEVNLYEDEMIGVNLIGNIVGVEALDNLIIHNDDSVLMEKLQSQNIDINDFQKLTSKMNYNMKARNIDRNNSMLSKIQLDLIEMFIKKDRSIEEIENFKYNLYTNLNVFDEKNKYQDLNDVYKIYEKIIDNYQLEHTTSKTR